MKDVYRSDTPKQVGVFGGLVNFGDPRRYRNFRSVGRGRIQFEEIICSLNTIGYAGPLSVEREVSAMYREQGALGCCRYVCAIDFVTSGIDFDKHFDSKC